MRFENEQDIDRETKAIRLFVKSFNGRFQKLDENDIDFRVYDNSGGTWVSGVVPYLC